MQEKGSYVESALHISRLSQMNRLSSSVGTAALLHCALCASVMGKGEIPVCQVEMEHLEQLPGRSLLGDGITVLNTLS